MTSRTATPKRRRAMTPKQRVKLYFSHGMTAGELIAWNVSIGRITKSRTIRRLP